MLSRRAALTAFGLGASFCAGAATTALLARCTTRILWPPENAAAEVAPPYVDARRHGVTGDGTDQTAGMLAANAAAETQGIGRVVLPAGVIGISETIVQKKAKIWEGQGRGNTGTRIRLASGVASDVDIFRITPAPGEQVGWGFAYLRLEGEAPGTGRHAIHLEPTTQGIALFEMRAVWCRPVGGWSFYVSNGTSNAPRVRGALTTSIFDHCQFNGGLHLAAVADSIGLTHCVVTQDNGVVLDQIAGAGNFVMQACNVTAARGVVIDGAAAPQIVRNYLETLPGRSYDLKDDALLSMQGTSRIIDGAIIQGNLIGDHNDRGNRYRAIYLNNTLRALVSDNNIYTKNGVPPAEIGTGARRTTYAQSNRQRGPGLPAAVDNGIGTSGLAIRGPQAPPSSR